MFTYILSVCLFVYLWIDGWVGASWIHRSVYCVCVSEWIEAWMDRKMAGWMNVYDGWIGGWMGGWMGGWVAGWMGEPLLTVLSPSLLQTVAWVAVIGLFYFARVTIAVILRQFHKEHMIWYAGMTQLGVTLGSLCMLDDISICRVYRNYLKLYCNVD